MGGIFSHHSQGHKKKKKPAAVPITDHDRAVLDLKTAKDRLKRYQVKVSPGCVGGCTVIGVGGVG